jgi:hypothetical protein
LHTKPATALVVGMSLVAGSAPAEEASAPTRVRSEHATIVRLITQATAQSATFRHEIEAIGGTDGLVYVYEAQCGRGVLACLMHTVTLAGPYRLLKVKLDLRRPELETMGALGHELRHAIEVLSDARVTSNSTITAFFQQLAPTDSYSFETPAALQSGSDVFAEMISNAKSGATHGPRKTHATR